MSQTFWNEAKITERIMAVFDRIGKMPTVQYLKDTGQNDLACQISKNGGFLEWAKRLGLPATTSDSHTGWNGEKAVAEILVAKGFEVVRLAQVKAPYDLIVQNLLRIDVKSAKLTTYGRVTGWFYRIGKLPQADLMAFHQLDTKKTYFIPWFLVPHTNVTISKSGGIYSVFADRFDLVSSMLKTRQKEAAEL